MSGRLFGACQYSAAFERTHSGLQQHDGNRAQSESEHPLFAEKTHLKLFTKVHLSCQLFCEEQPLEPGPIHEREEKEGWAAETDRSAERWWFAFIALKKSVVVL